MNPVTKATTMDNLKRVCWVSLSVSLRVVDTTKEIAKGLEISKVNADMIFALSALKLDPMEKMPAAMKGAPIP